MFLRVPVPLRRISSVYRHQLHIALRQWRVSQTGGITVHEMIDQVEQDSDCSSGIPVQVYIWIHSYEKQHPDHGAENSPGRATRTHFYVSNSCTIWPTANRSG